MLSEKQRHSVIRVLTLAYVTNRDMPLLQVCRKNRIRLWHDPKDAFGGSFENLPNPDDSLEDILLSASDPEVFFKETPAKKRTRLRWKRVYKKYRHQINIPGKRGTPPDYKEYVFWHEFCHFALERLQLMQRLIGYQGERQKYNDAESYWTQERLCEAFADAMLLYRRKVVDHIKPNLETFLFEDQRSVGHAEAASFSCKRIQKYLDEAETVKRNIDLRGLKKFLEHQERYIAESGFQQELPTNYFDSHREPYMHYVEDDADRTPLGMYQSGVERRQIAEMYWRQFPPKQLSFLPIVLPLPCDE
jgi:hypothetical protein